MEDSCVRFFICPSQKCDFCPSANLRPIHDCPKIDAVKETNQRILFHDVVGKRVYFTDANRCQQFENGTTLWDTIHLDDDFNFLRDDEILIDVYYNGPYLILLYYSDSEKITQFTLPRIQTHLESNLLGSIKQKLRDLMVSSMRERCCLTDRIRNTKEVVIDYLLDSFPEISSENRLRLADIAAYRNSALSKLIPLFLDDMIDEIYLDNPKSTIYFDHQKYGRIETTISFSETEIERLVTLIRAENNLHLDRNNPSLKTDVKFLDVLLRFAVNLPPLAADGFHMEIRRAKQNPFTLYDLIDNGTLTEEAAAIILLAVQNRFNITIAGAPGSGKTTLMNALDVETPSDWRKIYIEDALESRLSSNHHQIRIRVEPIDEMITSSSKSMEIIKTLHRSPDYLILGEIQTAEHTQALFQSIGAGIKTIQTCHSDSASSLISRWKGNHGIEEQNIALMDLIIVLDKPKPGESYRRVIEISEIRRGMNRGVMTFLGLNSIYDFYKSSSILNNWVDDGAFVLRMKTLGHNDLEYCYNAVLDTIKERRESLEHDFYTIVR